MIKEGRDPDKRSARKEIRNNNIIKKALELLNDDPNISVRSMARKIEYTDIAEGIRFDRIREILKDQNISEKMGGK